LSAAATPGGERPLRFCMLTTFYPPWSFGGDGTQVERLSHALADRGHQVTVVCAPKVHRALGGGSVRPAAAHPGVELIPLDDGVLSLTGTYLTGRPLRSRRRLRRVLDRGFDVIHFHNPSLLGAPALFEAGRGVKLYTAHEQWLLCPSHVLLRRDGSVCEDPPCWSCEIAHRRPPQPWRRTGMLERGLAHLDALIAPSRTSAELHRRFESLLRTEVIEHFVPDPGVADGARTPLAPARPYFLYSGRLEPIKGVSALIEAFRRRRSEDLVIAGDGGLGRRLRRQAADLPHVHFTGQLDSSELNGLYRSALAVVMPTLGHESFGLVPIEAFAAGTPALVRRFGAMRELVEETGAGLTFGSEAELDEALDRLAGDAALRSELGDRGRAAFAERFSEACHMDRYLGLVAELSEPERPPVPELEAQGRP
jgi:glycosyltransferase involved in cell wall biosynthesis